MRDGWKRISPDAPEGGDRGGYDQDAVLAREYRLTLAQRAKIGQPVHWATTRKRKRKEEK